MCRKHTLLHTSLNSPGIHHWELRIQIPTFVSSDFLFCGSSPAEHHSALQCFSITQRRSYSGNFTSSQLHNYCNDTAPPGGQGTISNHHTTSTTTTSERKMIYEKCRLLINNNLKYPCKSEFMR